MVEGWEDSLVPATWSRRSLRTVLRPIRSAYVRLGVTYRNRRGDGTGVAIGSQGLQQRSEDESSAVYLSLLALVLLLRLCFWQLGMSLLLQVMSV